MPPSRARVVGRFDPVLPEGGLGGLLAGPRRAELLAGFSAAASPVLGLPASRLRVVHNVWIAGQVRSGMAAFAWHRDAAGKRGHVSCVLGDRPTEFLLGEVPAALPREADAWAALEAGLQVWQAGPGELVWYDRQAVHRTPAGIVGSRVFLLACEAP